MTYIPSPRRALERKIEEHEREKPRRPDFITDNGGPFDMTDTTTGKPMGQVARYGLWRHDASRGKHQVIDTSNDRKALQEQYGVPDERVFTLGGRDA